MATLKATLGLGSEAVASGELLTSITKDLTVTEGGILVTEVDVTTEGTAVTILAAADHALGTKVYLRNLHDVNTLKFKLTNDANYEIILTPGQWAFFPWTAGTGLDIEVFADAIDTTLEYGTFI